MIFSETHQDLTCPGEFQQNPSGEGFHSSRPLRAGENGTVSPEAFIGKSSANSINYHHDLANCWLSGREQAATRKQMTGGLPAMT